jgi:hypothetical protein
VGSGQFWWVLEGSGEFGLVSCVLVRSGGCWWALVSSVWLLWVLLHSGGGSGVFCWGFWRVLVHSDLFWWSLVCSGVIWFFLVCCGMFLRVRIDSGELWWLLVCFAAF